LTKLVYIGGYGRSGSTLLEYLLAASPDVVACGEVLTYAQGLAAPLCSCGKPREACSVWGPLIDAVGPERRWTHRTLIRELLRHVEGRYGILVDSSKTAWGSIFTPFALRRDLHNDFRLVHLVRDPRGVCWSNVVGQRYRRGKPLPEIEHSPVRFLRDLRTLLGWWVANLGCEVFGWRFPNQYLRLRYEDLVDGPQVALNHVFHALRLGQGPSLDDLNENDNRHSLFGSAVRVRSLSPSEVSQDVRWKTDMKPGERRLISLLSWPLRRRYGY